MTVIRQDDFIQSIQDALQHISYYHPIDYIKALGEAYKLEQSPAAKDAIAQILTNSRICLPAPMSATSFLACSGGSGSRRARNRTAARSAFSSSSSPPGRNAPLPDEMLSPGIPSIMGGWERIDGGIAGGPA